MSSRREIKMSFECEAGPDHALELRRRLEKRDATAVKEFHNLMGMIIDRNGWRRVVAVRNRLVLMFDSRPVLDGPNVSFFDDDEDD